MSGRLLQKNISSIYQSKWFLLIAEIILMAGIGLLAVVLRTYLRIPMGIPGRQGLLIMLFFMGGRAFTRYPIATSVSALAASVFLLLPFHSINDPFIYVAYLLIGITVDALIYAGTRLVIPRYVLFAVVGGLGYMCIPLCRLAIHFTTGYPYHEFLKYGYLLPVISHFIFGALGSLLGAGLVFNFLRKN